MKSLVVLTLLAGCQSDIKTPFPAGLEELEPNPVPTQQGGARTETLVVQAMDDSDDLRHIFGRGYVLVPPATVWQAAKNPLADVAQCSTDAQDITPNNDPAYEFSFLVHYTVHDFVTVEWDDQWRFGTVTGTPEDPELAMIRHQKTDGSDFITTSEGTIELSATDDPNITELAFVEHLKAAGGDDQQVITGVQHNYDSLVSTSHGGPVTACP